MRTVRLACLASLLTAPLAHAATGGTPVTLSHSGYLLNGSDAPITGSVDLTVRVHATATNGTAEWIGTCAGVTVAAGYYAVTLGSAPCTGTGGVGDSVLDTSDVPVNAARWLELSVGGIVLTPRVALAPVVAAVRALDADQLGGYGPAHYATATHGHVAAEVSGLAAVATTGDWANVLNKPTTFPPATHGHAAAEVSGLATVATTGDWANVLNKPTTFPPATHGHAATDVSGIPAALAGATIPGALTVTGGVNGAVKLSTPTTCGTPEIGTLRWGGSSVEVCTASGWSSLAVGGSGDILQLGPVMLAQNGTTTVTGTTVVNVFERLTSGNLGTSGTVQASSVHSCCGSPAELADGSIGNFWSTAVLAVGTEVRVALIFPTAHVFTQVNVYPRTDCCTHLNWKSFSIEGSNDATTASNGTWTTLASGLNTANAVAWQNFPFANTVAFKVIRLRGPAQFHSAGEAYVQFAELQVFEPGGAYRSLVPGTDFQVQRANANGSQVLTVTRLKSGSAEHVIDYR